MFVLVRFLIGSQLIPALPLVEGRIQCEVTGRFRIQGKG